MTSNHRFSQDGADLRTPFGMPPPAETYRKVTPKQGQRTVRVHVTETARNYATEAQQFCTNKIVTARYDGYSFIPIILFQQFQRPANLYFLLISALECRPELSTNGWGTTLIPLLFVLILNGLKEGFDDWKRKSSDRKVNKRQVEILKDDSFQSDNWSTVIVGDILKVNTDEEFPADLVFLSSSDSQGLAYVETANLDGESILKLRHSFYKLARLAFEGGDMSLSVFSGMVLKCERPNNRMFQFEGSISLQGEGKLPVDETQILLRGATLRHTEWVLGAVVFAGRDTKLMRNTIAASRKVSSLEKNSNLLVAILLAVLFLLCLSLAIAGDTWTVAHEEHYYIPSTGESFEPNPGFTFVCVLLLRFLLLFNEFVPLSMYVTLELVKVVQCLFVKWDIHMFYHGTNTPARARASGLTEELGQVEYILSDKTGTLTQNLMAFIKCSIGGELYGKSSAETSFLTNADEEEYDETQSVHTVRYDPILTDLLNDSTKKAQLCRAFFTHVALCHTVIPRYLFNDDSEEVQYQSTSPDETALVQGAAECGFQLKERTAEEIVVFIELHVMSSYEQLEVSKKEAREQLPEILAVVQGQGLEHFRILAVLEFTPERKRMSIICQEHKGRIKLFCKGADAVIFKRLANSQSAVAEASLQHLEEFAKCGFRTLCMAERELSQAEFESWSRHFRQASLALDDRDHKLAAAADTIERDMVLLGVSAVEDKLQEGVPETVTLLAAAGIKLWVLTGDKLETAVSIGLSCNLLAESMHLFLLSESVAGSVPQLLRSMVEEARANYQDTLTSESSSMATVIEGASVGVALEDSNRLVFLELCQYCRAVVCCRVSPIQKAQITRLVKDDGRAVTLAIGDGANDVGMIKAAQIGVGISGREGRAAVMASDYAIGQFRFLSRLLLVHGRWSYKRNRDMVMYSIYKNIVLTMGNFYLSFFSVFSAQSLYPEFLTISYNVLWTSLPTFLCAILDKDVKARTAENNPQLYAETQLEKSRQFIWHMNGWILTALWHSAVAFTLPCLAVLSSSKNGETGGIWVLGLSVYTVSILIVTLKLAFCTKSYTVYHALSMLLSIIIWLCLIYALTLSYQWSSIWTNIKAEGTILYASPSFWLLLALSPIAACLPDAAFEMFCQRKSPSNSQSMREMEHGFRKGTYVKHHPGFVERVRDFSNEEDESVMTQPEEAASEPVATEDTQEYNTMKIDATLSSELNIFPQRMTWREVVNDDEIEGVDQMRTLSRYGRRSSGGFQVVKSHTDTPEAATPHLVGLVAQYCAAEGSKGLEDGDVPKVSAMSSEIVEALGIEKAEGVPTSTPKSKAKEGTSKASKAASPWTNFRKRWSVAPAPQHEAPVGISPQTVPKASSKATTISRKPRKRKPKPNSAMSRLTRLASTRIMLADSSEYSDEAELVRPSLIDEMSQRDDDAENPRDYPTSLPFVPVDEEQSWDSEKSSKSKLRSRPRFPTPKQPSHHRSRTEMSRSYEYFEATGWAEPNRPFGYQPHTDNRNSSNYLGYSASKSVAPTVMPPAPLRQPPPVDMVSVTRNNSTNDHYSRLTGEPVYHANNLENTREPRLESLRRNKGDWRGDTRSPGQYAHLQTDYKHGVGFNKDQNDDHNDPHWDIDHGEEKDYEQTSSEMLYPTTTRDTYLNQKPSTYDPPVHNYPKSAYKGKRKLPVSTVGTPTDIESGGELAQRRSPDYNGQLQPFASPSDQKKEQQRFRRSSSGHISFAVPDISGTPPHESPFANYAKHNAREGPRQRTYIVNNSEDASPGNPEASHFKDAHTMKFGKPTKPLKSSPETVERARGGPPLFSRSSSGHISYKVSDTSGTPPHDSPFADYTKHGLRERPRRNSKTPKEDESGGFFETGSSSQDGSGSVPPSKFILTGRSPWASETGDPSHSFIQTPGNTPQYNKTPSPHNTAIPLAVSQKNTVPGKPGSPLADVLYTTPEKAEKAEKQAASSGDAIAPVKILRQSKLIEFD